MWCQPARVAILERAMIRRRMLFVLTVFALTSGSCILPSEPNSRFRVDRAWGFAGGANLEEATRLAGIVEEVLPELRVLGKFEERPLRIHFAKSTGPKLTEGITVDPFIGKPWVAVRRDREDVENTVAHELVHFYFDSVLTKFPAVMQEGMAEHVAGQLFPVPDRRVRLLVFVGAAYLDHLTIEVSGATAKQSLPYVFKPVPPIEEVFRIDWYGNLKADARARQALYGLGLLVAERIGWEGLLDLAKRCDEAGRKRVPAEWIRAAGGIEPPNQVNLRNALFEAFGVEDAEDAGAFRVILKD